MDYPTAARSYQALMFLLEHRQVPRNVPEQYAAHLTALATAINVSGPPSQHTMRAAPKNSQDELDSFEQAAAPWKTLAAYFQDEKVIERVNAALSAERARLAVRSPLDRARTRLSSALVVGSGGLIEYPSDVAGPEEWLSVASTIETSLSHFDAASKVTRGLLAAASGKDGLAEAHTAAIGRTASQVADTGEPGQQSTGATSGLNTITSVGSVHVAYALVSRSVAYVDSIRSLLGAATRVNADDEGERLRAISRIVKESVRLLHMATKDLLLASSFALSLAGKGKLAEMLASAATSTVLAALSKKLYIISTLDALVQAATADTGVGMTIGLSRAAANGVAVFAGGPIVAAVEYTWLVAEFLSIAYAQAAVSLVQTGVSRKLSEVAGHLSSLSSELASIHKCQVLLSSSSNNDQRVGMAMLLQEHLRSARGLIQYVVLRMTEATAFESRPAGNPSIKARMDKMGGIAQHQGTDIESVVADAKAITDALRAILDDRHSIFMSSMTSPSGADLSQTGASR